MISPPTGGQAMDRKPHCRKRSMASLSTTLPPQQPQHQQPRGLSQPCCPSCGRCSSGILHQHQHVLSGLSRLLLVMVGLLATGGPGGALAFCPSFPFPHSPRQASSTALAAAAAAASGDWPLDCLRQRASHAPRHPEYGYTAVLVVPTGIGASMGGYAGDALPVARGLASVADTVVTHPNVMNGASLYWPATDSGSRGGGLLYTEGYALDAFAAGRWGLSGLSKGGGHRIGLVLDKAMEPDMRTRHLQVAEAARATLGLNVWGYAITDEDVGVELAMSPGGASWGRVRRPDTILRAAKKLVLQGGCSAIAIVTRFPDDEDEDMLQAYRMGCGVDAVGGAEAIISHMVTAELKVPCAHAPGLSPLDADPDISPRSCAEELGYTFLPCVLANLHRAPLLLTDPSDPSALARGLWGARDVDAIVAPASACGGAAVLALMGAPHSKAILVAVEENETAMRAAPEDVLLASQQQQPGEGGGRGGGVVRVRSYLEAMGLLAAHKAGINPQALTPHSPRLRQLQ